MQDSFCLLSPRLYHKWDGFCYLAVIALEAVHG